MNRFDILPQNMTRAADAQSARGAGQAFENKAKGDETSQESFSSFLDGMSGGKTDEAASTQTGSSDGFEETSKGTGLGSVEEDLLQMVLADQTQASDASAQGQTQGGNAALSMLEGLLPRVLVPVSTGNGQASGQSGSLPPSSLLNIEAQASDDASKLVPKAALHIAVQSQETHFRPVIDSMHAAPDFQNAPSDEAGGALPGEILLPKGEAKDGEKAGATKLAPIHVASASAGEGASMSQSAEETADLEMNSVKGLGAQAEASRQASNHAKADETQSLPPTTLQRIAGAVFAEARSMASEAGAQSARADNLFRPTNVKASDSVLRVLNLQLHPAELGLVTIKMKLSGDSLEMELQVENEETARMLQNDTEKLSNLLRGSGYRTDVINIQTTDFAPQDRMTSSRQPSFNQNTGQTFDQNASHSESGSRHQDQGQRDSGTGVHKNDKEDVSPRNNSNGIYL